MSDARVLGPTEPAVSVPLSRREFLYYLWGASMAVFLAGSAGASLWFMLPRFREGEFGGVFTVPVSDVPPADSDPMEYAAGRFWLVNVGPKTVGDPRQPHDYKMQAGVKALYKVCVHLGCIYRWTPTNDRFECPCHGSKYLKSGTRIDGPARPQPGRVHHGDHRRPGQGPGAHRAGDGVERRDGAGHTRRRRFIQDRYRPSNPRRPEL